MKKLIKKLRSFFNLTQVECIIEYNNPLSIAQFTEIVTHMINKFPGNCKPNSISGTPNSTKVKVTFSSDCMTIEELTRIANATIERITPTNTVKSITKNQ